MLTRTITIIPNENNYDIDVFYAKSSYHYHEEIIEEFCMSNNFDNRDKYDLIDQGFIIISTVGDLVTCEIPSYITEKQFNQLKSMEKFLTGFDEFIGAIINDEMTIISEIPLGYSKNIIDYFYEVIMHKCLNKEENRDR